MTSDTLPFIYIAGLRRSGTTVLAEALTMFPYSFIFREPRLAKGRFNLKDSDHADWLQQGIDIRSFVRRIENDASYRRQDGVWLVNEFKNFLVPGLLNVVRQIGVKEIQHDNWRAYYENFPSMKVLLTGRDPRDMYLSLRDRLMAGKGSWKGEWTPAAFAETINRQFLNQLAIIDILDYHKVRYEDFCLRPNDVIAGFKEFVNSPVPDGGNIGFFNARNPDRVNEYYTHGRQITAKRVHRWQQKSDVRMMAEVKEVFERMHEFCSFWGYSA